MGDFKKWGRDPSNWGDDFEMGVLIPSVFCLFTLPPSKNQKNQNFENMEKLLEISSLYIYIPKTTWGMRYGSWDKDRQTKFLSFWAIFPPENQNFEWKKLVEMSSFYTCIQKITIIWCMLPEIFSATVIIFCQFGPFFALLSHYWPQKLKFGKNVRYTWRYYPFTHEYRI